MDEATMVTCMTCRGMDDVGKMKSERRSARFRESTSNGEVDGSATLEGFLQAFVETLVGCGRLGNETRKGELANDNLAVGAGECTIAVAERAGNVPFPICHLTFIICDLIFSSREMESRMFDRITDTLAVDVQMTIDAPRLVLLTYNYYFHTFENG